VADNTQIPVAASSGDVIRTEDRSAVKTPVSLLDAGGTGVTEKIVGDAGITLPVSWPGESLQRSTGSSSAVAAGGSATFDSTQITSGKTARLYKVVVAATVAIKVVLSTVANGVATTQEVDVGWDGTWKWESRHPETLKQAYDAGAGLDGFRVVATNLDTALAADIYCTFQWNEVAT